MRHEKEVVATHTVVDDILCDCCGKSCRDDHDMNYEMATLRSSWGYCSRKDGTTWSCDLCEDCADKIKTYIESLGGQIVISNYI